MTFYGLLSYAIVYMYKYTQYIIHKLYVAIKEFVREEILKNN